MAIATPWAVLLCKFTDDESEPYTTDFARQFFTAGAQQGNIVSYWHDVSHNHVDLSGNKVHGWLTVPKKTTDYKGSGANPAGRQELVNWAKQAATAAGVQLQSYYGVVVCTNVSLDLFGLPQAAVINPGSMSLTGVAHEMGHGYLLSHSRDENPNSDYQDPYDIMSAFNVVTAPHPTFGISGPALNAVNMETRGWLDPSRVEVYPGTGLPKTVTLRPLLRPDLPGPLAVRHGPYLVEYRTPAGWDAGIINPCVLVHRLKDGHSAIQVSVNGGKAFGTQDHFVKDSIRLRVNSIQGDSAVVELQYFEARPPPARPNPCDWMRKAILYQRKVVIELAHKLGLAMSDAERAELERQLEEEVAQLDALEQDYAVFCRNSSG